MRSVLRHWRRLVLGLFLLGLGYVLYQRLPPVERWSVRLDEDAATFIFCFSPDGRFVFSYHPEITKTIGPFRKRDANTGMIVAEASVKDRRYESQSAGPSVFPKRFWAGLPEGESGILEIFDLESGKESR